MFHGLLESSESEGRTVRRWSCGEPMELLTHLMRTLAITCLPTLSTQILSPFLCGSSSSSRLGQPRLGD